MSSKELIESNQRNIDFITSFQQSQVLEYLRDHDNSMEDKLEIYKNNYTGLLPFEELV